VALKRGNRGEDSRKVDANQPAAKKSRSYAWLVIAGPLAIVLFLSLFKGPPWVREQSTKGALGEAETHNVIGLTAMKQGRYHEALLHFNTALSIKPDYAEPFANVGIVYYLTGDLDRAIACFNKSLELSSEKSELTYNNLGMVYAKKGDFDRAQLMFRKALGAGTNVAAVYRNIGSLCTNRGDFAGAAEAYQAAIANRPSLRRQYLDMLTDAYFANKDEKDIGKGVIEAYQRGVSDSELVQYDSVIVGQFARSDSKLAEDYKNLGSALVGLGRIDEALAAYREALQMKPDYTAILNRIGILLAERGDFDGAMHSFQEALRIDPNYREAQENLEICGRKMRQQSGSD
jgi:superkiller protein 3